MVPAQCSQHIRVQDDLARDERGILCRLILRAPGHQAPLPRADVQGCAGAGFLHSGSPTPCPATFLSSYRSEISSCKDKQPKSDIQLKTTDQKADGLLPWWPSLRPEKHPGVGTHLQNSNMSLSSVKENVAAWVSFPAIILIHFISGLLTENNFVLCTRGVKNNDPYHVSNVPGLLICSPSHTACCGLHGVVPHSQPSVR